MPILDRILKFIPNVRKPSEPLSFRDKLKWTAVIMSVYFLMFSTPAYGVSTSTLKLPIFQIINIIFASRAGTLLTVGIGPIVLSSIVLQLFQGAGLIKIDMQDPEQKGKFQSIQKLGAIAIAIIEAVIYTGKGLVPLISPSFFGIVAFQLAVSSICLIFMDEMMVKYGITSGINLFIAGGVSYAIVTGTSTILVNEAIQALAAGGASALPNAILAFGPLVFAVIVMLISIYIYDIKVELPLAFSQFRGVGGRLPIPLLYVSVIPVILATTLIASMGVWFTYIAGASGSLAPIAHFIAYYQQVPTGTGATAPTLSGGLLYLISPDFPSPYSSTYGGIGGYGPYVSFLASSTSPLYIPWGSQGILYVPEWVHIITYTLAIVVLCVLFGTFWVEMTGQSPKSMAEQLQEIGWQIPGFRRDPRVIESVLNKYLPSITVLGSILVALLAVLATLTGAIGTGIGVLLMVGIMYMLYQQLEQQHMLEGMPALDKFLS
ncbi:MAG: hypothetical protein KGH72_01145 [Candidatus Micrarchaeota archaeon]|nr:hypothetical protein [Candidatus Micrarchaeota archaeon]